ncbi:alpha/beta hydrolase family protein [Leucobacter sp. NPDC015123]|uniref:alpha/beta hydrolase family protein n=1 Tax=Leucobacter sp. NPDC015123 TaxID=3364129 RepID=UPI0036F4968D
MRTSQSIALAGAATIGLAGGVVGTAAGLAAYLGRRSVVVDRGLERPVTVRTVLTGDEPRVWIRGEGAGARGQHSLLFDAPGTVPGEGIGAAPTGHARLGPVLARNGADVLRPVVAVDNGALVAGCTGRMVGWWYTDPAEPGYRVEPIRYDTELGPMDAWIVHPRRPRKKRWAVHVHGRGASPAETFRGIEPFARAGITSLIVTYRNDLGQPAGLNGRYGMGLSESRDVDAAIAEARSRGAERVTLMGWSMGGTASLVSVANGSHRAVIDGLVLESPGADWAGILRDKASEAGLPGWIATAGMMLLACGTVSSGEEDGIDFAALAPEELARSLDVPTLILASPDDRFVPWHGARAIADARPDLVELVSIPGAGHVRLWNVDPERWEGTVLRFVAGLPKPGWRGQ